MSSIIDSDKITKPTISSHRLQMSGNLILKTGGDGLWSKKIKDVCVEKIELICNHYHYDDDFQKWNGELRAYFDNTSINGWISDTDGFIFTDKTFLKGLKEFLSEKHLKCSEQSKQGKNYVSLEVRYEFISSWSLEFKEPPMKAPYKMKIDALFDFTPDPIVTNHEMQTNVTLKTSGNGFWSDKIANVYVTKFELTCFHYHYGEDEDEWHGELCVYFDNTPNIGWNVETDGLIYSDKKFEHELKAFLSQMQLDCDEINYSEQGMQGDNYVSLDVDYHFIKSWSQKFKEPSMN